MSNRLSRILALMGVSAVLAIGGTGLAQASPDHSGHDHHCKGLHGKKKKNCEKKHHHDHHNHHNGSS